MDALDSDNDDEMDTGNDTTYCEATIQKEKMKENVSEPNKTPVDLVAGVQESKAKKSSLFQLDSFGDGMDDFENDLSDF